MIGTKTNSPQRFVPASFAAAACFSFLAAACSSGGGGGGVVAAPDATPVIVTASFVGAGTTPATGDRLILVFSESISVATGTQLDDADVVLSANATLGTITVVPTVVSSNTLSISLGAGVTFAPGTSTISLGASNDAVRDSLGQLGAGGTPVTIGTSDGASPTITGITISGIDSALNGTGPAGGTLQVPANGWSIDLAYTDNVAIAPTKTQITANVQVLTAGGAVPAGSNLVPSLTAVTSTTANGSFSVPPAVTFPNGPVILTCLAVDLSGLASTPVTFNATVRAFDVNLQPFETSTLR